MYFTKLCLFIASQPCIKPFTKQIFTQMLTEDLWHVYNDYINQIYMILLNFPSNPLYILAIRVY